MQQHVGSRAAFISASCNSFIVYKVVGRAKHDSFFFFFNSYFTFGLIHLCSIEVLLSYPCGNDNKNRIRIEVNYHIRKKLQNLSKNVI